MAKPRGRPKGTGKPEDEPVLREAVRAVISGEVASLHAAAERFAERVPGKTHEARKRRLYNKLLKRSPELEKEILAEESDGDGIDDEEWKALFKIGQDLYHDKSYDDKLARLTGTFCVAAEIEALKNDLTEIAKSEGFELSSTLTGKLSIVLYAYRIFSQSASSFREKERIRKFRRRKEFAAKRQLDLQANNEEKEPESAV